MKPPRAKKAARSSLKLRAAVDATRLALASVERIRSVLARKGKQLGPPVSDPEIDDRERLLRHKLPPSYLLTLHVTGDLGPPERLLDAEGITQAKKRVDAQGLVPFCEADEGRILCFDRKSAADKGELPVVEVSASGTKARARSFGEWLDSVADAREEALASAANIPTQLKTLLIQLGFTFDDPIVGRLETGDVPAIEALVGGSLTEQIRGPHDRLFDSSGKASLTLNLDEFSLAASLRTGIVVFNAEDVFRWLRTFRDESFFGEPSPKHAARPDTARDLRRAPREPPLVLRGVVRVSALPSARHFFRAASGPSARDFYVLGRTHSTSDRATSLLLHVVSGSVASAHTVDEPLQDLHVTPEGTLWGLSANGSALRLLGGSLQAFSIARPRQGRASYYGIGSGAGRVLVWGAGALLAFDGEEFVPFEPDAALEPTESVVALAGSEKEITMLVCGEGIGAVARFDGRRWLPISAEQVLDGAPVDLDLYRKVAVVLGKDGALFRMDEGAPRPVLWDSQHEAFHTGSGGPRPLRHIRGVDGGALLASDGGVLVTGSGDPVFYEASGTSEPARLARVGGEGARDGGIVVCCGPHLWLWQSGAMSVLDVREF